MKQDGIRTERLPFMLLAAFSLIAGLLAGLQRMGWNLPTGGIAPSHGAIMVGGFLGSLIVLEKIIPLNRRILYLIPFLSGGSLVFFFFDKPFYSMLSLLAASGGLCLVFLLYLWQHRSFIYIIMLAGAICWFVGNALLIYGNAYPASVPWWMAFVFLIIASERLELMKFLPVSRMQKAVLLCTLCLFVAGCLMGFHDGGNYVTGMSLLGGSIWFLRHDVVGINLTKTDLTRYVGVALLFGYIALLVTGILLTLIIDQPMGYDLIVHCFFIGFAFSMIFAHGPIILPGVLGINVRPFHPIFYFWLILLHGSWITRAVADISLNMQLRQYSGVASSLAILGYLLSLAVITIQSRRAFVVGGKTASPT